MGTGHQWLRDTNMLVYGLVILFGISSWLDMCGIFIELPLLVQYLPEGWNLPSYMVTFIQIANVGPLLFTVASSRWPHLKLEVPVSYIIISIGALSCLLLAFLWRVTSEIAGIEHSTALLVLQFFLALVDCTSSVAFLPFMSVFKPQYMTAYFIGEGFSGLIPSVVALTQGAGYMECVKVPKSPNSNHTLNETADSSYTTTTHSHIKSSVPISIIQQINATARNHTIALDDPAFVTATPSIASTSDPSGYLTVPVFREPRFGVSVFFTFLTLLMLCSLVSVFLLHRWSYCQREYAKDERPEEEVEKESFVSEYSFTGDHAIMKSIKSKESPEYCNGSCNIPEGNGWVNEREDVTNSYSISPETEVSYRNLNRAEEIGAGGFSRSKYALYLMLTAWLAALGYGFLPSLQTYSCLPYGILTFYLSVNLPTFANPLACVVLVFIKPLTVRSTLLMVALGTGLAAYLTCTASLSPEPPLVRQFSGSFIVVSCWTLAKFFMTFAKVSMVQDLRHKGKKVLMWVGAAEQAGACLGALTSFLMVNVLKMFTVANPCRQ